MDALTREIDTLTAELMSAIDRDEVTYGYVDYMEYRFSSLLTIVGIVSTFPPQMYALISDIVSKLRSCLDGHGSTDADFNKRVDVIRDGQPCRPRLDISRDKMEMVLSYRLTGRQSASLLGISLATFNRRLREYQLNTRPFASLSDANLDAVVADIVRDFPRYGSVQVKGQLQSRGIYVQRERVRESMRRVDPVGERDKSYFLIHLLICFLKQI